MEIEDKQRISRSVADIVAYFRATRIELLEALYTLSLVAFILVHDPVEQELKKKHKG